MTTQRPFCVPLFRAILAIAPLIAIGASTAFGRFMRAPEVPVERLLRNTAAYVKEKSDDPQGYYLLGRVNALAFVHKSTTLRAFERKGQPLPNLDPYQGRGRGEARPPTPEQLCKHVVDSVANFRKAIAMKKDSGLYHLGLAYILEVGADAAWQIGAPPGSATPDKKPTPEQIAKWQALIADLGSENLATRQAAQKALADQMPAAGAALQAAVKDEDPERQSRGRTILADWWKQRARAEYLKAHTFAFPKDAKIRRRPLRGLQSLASYEAGKSYLRLAGDSAETDKHAATVKENLKTLDAKPRGPVTPMVFSLLPAQPLQDLLAPGKTVRFDLDGDSQPQRWPWLKPTTGLLVWDPTGRGRITSGRQLFGSVTFWMFFHDGFHALNVLDDNRDGVLAGSEMAGIAVWFDRNSDGRSDATEVVPVEKLGVASIRTRPALRTPEGPAHPTGVKLSDGSTRPLYDWTPSPVGK